MNWKTGLRIGIVASAVVLASSAQGEQDRSAPAAASDSSRTAQANAVNVPSVFGTQINIMQIPAAAFTVRYSGTTFGYGGNGYTTILTNGSSDHDVMWAPVILPSGVVVEYVDLYANDTDATNDISASFRGYPGHLDGDVSNVTFASVASSGAVGHEYYPSTIFSHTINNDTRYGAGYQYTVVINVGAPGGGLAFKAADLWWFRQVSAGPVTSDFTDVPTSSGQYKFIEALYHAGITGGCGTGLFCPNANVTRGQMAVFLAQALGLHFNN